MACALTQGLVLDCRLSFGGVKTVYIMEHPLATTITQSAGVVTTITKATGKVFRKYNLIAHVNEADEVMTNDRPMGSQTVKQSIKFPINKLAVAVRNELLLLAQNNLLMVVLDENGIGWLHGVDYGLVLTSATAKTGKELKDRNGYELVFEGDEKYLAPQVDAATLLTLETAGA